MLTYSISKPSQKPSQTVKNPHKLLKIVKISLEIPQKNPHNPHKIPNINNI